MLFRQLFDSVSCTYTYLVASRPGGEALIVDPVLEKVDRYLTLMDELDLRLVKAVDTHVHADHITGLGALRDRCRCITVMGERSAVDVVSMRVADGDRIEVEGISLKVLYTPGHTDDSYSFLLGDRVFTGDTLLIRGTGRTDFQNGNPRDQYHSLFDCLLRLPDDTLVYPAHDYKGDTVSSIGEEKACNPRLQVGSIDEYVDLMNGLNLSNPKMMDVAVPANLKIGLSQADVAARGWALDCEQVAVSARSWRHPARGPARSQRAGQVRRAARLGARPLPRSPEPPRGGRPAPRVLRRHRPDPGLLLRLRRTFRDGGRGGPQRRLRRGPPPPRRPGCVEEGRGAGRFRLSGRRTCRQRPGEAGCLDARVSKGRPTGHERMTRLPDRDLPSGAHETPR